MEYPREGLITRNTHVKYQNSSTRCSKVISKVKVSERRTELQNIRQDKNNMPPIFDLGGIKIKGKGTAEKYKHLKLGNHIYTDKKEISNTI